MNKILIIILLVACFPGCVTVPLDTYEGVYEKTTVKSDAYKGVTWVSSPLLSNAFIMDGIFFRLRTEGTFHQLYCFYRDDNWAFLDSAFGNGGMQFKFIEIDRDISGGKIEEEFAIMIPESYLLELAKYNLDLDIKVSGRRDEIIARVPGFHIKAYLDKANVVFNRKQ